MKFLSYADFICLMQTQTQEKLGEGMQVRLHTVTKNNAVQLDALSISELGGKIAPTVYLNEYYQAYLDGQSVPELAESVVGIYQKCRPQIDIDPDFYTDFDRVKDRLVCRLVNWEKNRELLKQMPSRPFLDLAAVVYYSFEDERMGLGSISVYESHREQWGISAEELFELARENTLRLQPTEFLSMEGMISKFREKGMDISVPECGEEDGVQPMYVLTNRNNYFGAAMLLFDTVLQDIAEQLDDDFWVLPSSVHECIVVPAALGMNCVQLRDMVREVNRREVAPEDFLSDEIYFYQEKIHRLRPAAYKR